MLAFGKSLIYISMIIVNSNINGPKIDPWGTPIFIGKVSQCTFNKHSDDIVSYSIGNMNK